MRVVFIPILFLTLSIVSCKKKNKDPEPVLLTGAPALTSQSWKFASASSSGFDITFIVPDCIKDDEIRFSSDFVYIKTNPVRCDTTVENATDTGIWRLADNDTKLFLDADSVSVNVLNSSVFKFNKYIETIGYTAEITMVPK